MPFHVRDSGLLRHLHAGDTVSFRLAVDNEASWIENLRVVRFESAEREPSLADRLKLLDSLSKDAVPALPVGAQVPGFTLTDQGNKPVSLSALRGKVVALNFVYTRCPLPDYCFRLSNNFSALQKRFRGNPDVVLLTISFDPQHDQPEVLARYAAIWKADPALWHFLTGDTQEVDRICALFGVAHWRDDGLFTHSLHTVVIGRDGRLRANLEGNRFTARQLVDLVEAQLPK